MDATAQQVVLRKIPTVPVSGSKRFVTKDHIQSANIGWMGPNFREFFLDKIEENVGDTTIAIYRLEKASLDAPIRAQLGDRAKIKLCHFFALIEKQSKREDGPLLTHGYANVAYIEANDGKVWVVGAHWRSGDGFWHVEAFSVENPSGWFGNGQFLACDS